MCREGVRSSLTLPIDRTAATRSLDAMQRRVARFEPQRPVAADTEDQSERDVDDTAVTDRDDPLAGEPVDNRVDGHGDPSDKHVRWIRTERLPTSFHHREPTFVLGGRELLGRYVMVGLRVVFDQTVDHLDDETMRCHDRRRSFRGPTHGTRNHRVDRFRRGPCRETCACSCPSAVSGGSAGTPRPGAMRSGSP